MSSSPARQPMPWGWKALRAAMGSTFRVPVLNERDPRAALERLRAAGLSVIATTPHDGAEMYDVDLRRAVRDRHRR